MAILYFAMNHWMVLMVLQMQEGIIIVVVLLGCSFARAQEMPHHICGRDLADALDFICGQRGFHWQSRELRGKYFSPHIEYSYMKTLMLDEKMSSMLTYKF